MSKRWWHFYYGYLIIKITGVDPKRLFPILFQEGIVIWEVKKEEEGITFFVSQRDFQALVELISSMNCPFTVLKQGGLPFYISCIRERSFLFSGLFVILLLIYILSSFVWFVQIQGLTSLDEGEIYGFLSRQGLYPGAYGRSLQLDRIEKNMLKWEERIAWVNIEAVGSMVLVKILEKVLPRKEEAGHLYSRRDAIVTKIIPLTGEAQVAEGDTVVQGEILITVDKGEVARGIVEGRTWYQASGYALQREVLEFQTGLYRSSYSLQSPLGFSLLLYGPQESPYPAYQLETSSQLLYGGRNLNLPIELIKKDYHQLLTLQILRTPAMVKAKAQEEALKKILEQLQDGATILAVKHFFEAGKEGVGVQLVMEVWESIVAEKEECYGRK